MNKEQLSQGDQKKGFFKRLGLLLILLAFGLLLIGCNLPGVTPPQQPAADEDVVGTAVQQTLIASKVSAEQTRVAALQNPPEQQQPEGEAPTATFTPEISETPSETPSPTLSPTPENPIVSVSENTNCRVGPGQPYELIGALLVGEETEIVARDPSGLYWYVRNLDRGGYCWLWGYYATTSGNTESLPVFTPPPTPTFTPSPTLEPNFSVAYHHFDNCGAVWYIAYSISNNGGLTFQSVSTTTKDTDTNETVNYTKDAFDEWDICILQSSADDLTPGESGFTVSESLNNDPDNHTINATIKLCSEDGQGGTCVSKSITFVP